MEGKFRELVIAAHQLSKEGNLVGIVYGPISTYGFSDINDIHGFVDSSPADMLYLKSKLTDMSVDIYEYDLVDFKVKRSESTIYIKLRNREVGLMF